MAVIIGVNYMVYTVCKCEAIQLVTDTWVFDEFEVRGVQIGFDKV